MPAVSALEIFEIFDRAGGILGNESNELTARERTGVADSLADFFAVSIAKAHREMQPVNRYGAMVPHRLVSSPQEIPDHPVGDGRRQGRSDVVLPERSQRANGWNLRGEWQKVVGNVIQGPHRSPKARHDQQLLIESGPRVGVQGLILNASKQRALIPIDRRHGRTVEEVAVGL